MPISTSLSDELYRISAFSPRVLITLNSLADSSREEAFGWLVVRLAEENKELRDQLVEVAVADKRHPVSDLRMLESCRDGEVIAFQEATK